jgi:hypothetical protein
MLRVLAILLTVTPSNLVCVLALTLSSGDKLFILVIGELGVPVAILIVELDKLELSDTTGEITSG